MLGASMNDYELNGHGIMKSAGPDSHGFKHRKNKDGSYDSICLTCYLTAASTYD